MVTRTPASLRILIASLVVILGGCSSIVSTLIAKRSSYDLTGFGGFGPLELGFEKHRFCSARSGLCMSYLTGEPMLDEEEISLKFDFDAGGQKDAVALFVTRDRLPPALHGTVLLLHGFRASKEFMVSNALYFRFLGFRVIVPDLLGHGENSGQARFGPKDSEVLAELMDQSSTTQDPLYIFGYSMGAVAASYLASSRTDVVGLILQAPMPVFDRAVLNYVKRYSPVLSRLLTRRGIKAGALKALTSADITLMQTDIKPVITGSPVPTLIIASPGDPVSPYDYFKDLTGVGKVSVVSAVSRSHPAMGVIADSDSDVILPWLRLAAPPSASQGN